LNVEADATRKEAQERSAGSNLDIVGMSSEAEDRKLGAGGGEL
jgi:hypothetical protein